jgi:predicted nucleic acid-binding Zn ribbon protein
MIYEFQCQTCGDRTDRHVRVAQRHDPQPCQVADCDGEAVYRFNPENTAFVLKGHGWPSRDAKATKSMKARQAKAKKAARDHVRRPTLQPNFAGQPTETWADAKDAAHQFNAKEKPEVPLDTSSYDGLVEKERISKPKPKATSVASPA